MTLSAAAVLSLVTPANAGIRIVGSDERSEFRRGRLIGPPCARRNWMPACVGTTTLAVAQP